MPVPSAITDLSQTAGSNSPAGSESPNTADDYFRAHASFIAQLRDGKNFTDPTSLASAGTTDIGAENSMFVQITGTTTITSFGTNYNGPRFLRFSGALTLTHNATTLNLPGGSNLTTEAGDTCIAIPNSTPNGWNVVQYQRAVNGPSAPVVTSLNGGQLAGLRNKVLNGAMEIAQEGTSFTNVLDGQYNLEGWMNTSAGTTAVVDIAQSTDVPATNEFQNSLRATVTTADASIAAGDLFTIVQRIEGYNVRDLLLSATITVSFWVRSSKTGTHCLTLKNGGNDRALVATYTVDAANTWEKKTITPGGLITGGTWNWTNGVGLMLVFGLAVGSTFQTTAGSWQTGNFYGSSAQVNCLDTIGNIFAITGVQLEIGSAATPFEHRPFGLELYLCERYFEKSFPLATAPAQNAGVTGAVIQGQYVGASATQRFTETAFKNRKRTTPTIITYNPNNANNQPRNTDTNTDWGAPTVTVDERKFVIVANSPAATGVGQTAAYHFTANARL